VRRLWFPLLLGLAGVAVLGALGLWQLQRLAWKEALIADIAARIAAAPVPLPETPDPARDQYLPVAVAGALGGEEAHVLTSLPGQGPGFRVISALTAGDRRVLVDLGFVPETAKDAPRVAERVVVTGNLFWPPEAPSAPPPDAARGIWFADDPDAMAAALGTEPLIVVARDVAGAEIGTRPLPVSPTGIRNDHLGYAVTWFGLAAVWAVMSGWLVWRTLRRTA
jgi:surfeit locus 1 family protein